jgi:hypothetical protein
MRNFKQSNPIFFDPKNITLIFSIELIIILNRFVDFVNNFNSF